MLAEERGKANSSHILINKEEINELKDFVFISKQKDYLKPLLGDSLIIIKPESEEIIPTIIHEFAHRLQWLFPEIQNYYQEFFSDRTKDNIYLPLNSFAGFEDFEDSIQVKKDAFFNPYFGRIYAEDKNKGEEVMTMSFQSLFSPKHSREFLEKDPELFAFTLGLLLRIGK